MDDATKFTYKTGFGWKNLNLLKNSYKIIMMTVINDTSLRLMLAIQIPSDLPFFPVTMNIGKKKNKKKNKQTMEKYKEEKLCCNHKNLKAGLGLRTNIRKSLQGNSVQSRSLVEALYRHERRIE